MGTKTNFLQQKLLIIITVKSVYFV